MRRQRRRPGPAFRSTSSPPRASTDAVFPAPTGHGILARRSFKKSATPAGPPRDPGRACLTRGGGEGRGQSKAPYRPARRQLAVWTTAGSATQWTVPKDLSSNSKHRPRIALLCSTGSIMTHLWWWPATGMHTANCLSGASKSPHGCCHANIVFSTPRAGRLGQS